MPTQYDPKILQRYVEDLYLQAQYIIRGYATSYGLGALVFGAIAGFGISRYASAAGAGANDNIAILGGVIGVFIGIVIGIDRGKKRAWEFKFKAQELLLQMQIERNTRAAVEQTAEIMGADQLTAR